MTDSPFAEFQTDNLMLLMGTNPLPNYVAARLLARSDTKLHLVVTHEVRQAGKTLLDLLGRDPEDEELYLEVPSSDPDVIFERVQKRVSNTPGSWGLHYTGGKKSMVTHAYRAVEAVLTTPREKGTYSYLDADTLEMVIESPRYPAVQRPKAHKEVDVSIEQLLKMYGRPLSAPPETEPYQPEACKKIVNYCQDKVQREAWSCWAAALRRNGKNLTNQQARQVDIPDSLQPVLGGKTIADLEATWQPQKKAEQIGEWLHGKWLEHYVLAEINSLPKDLHLNDVGCSIKPRSIAHFEVDIVVMQGYRMFAISATTDIDGLNKLKLMEITVRAQQMGGDEARVALVTFKDQTEGLQNQVREVWGDHHRSRIRVFGLNQLPNLADQLAAWFKED
jgi:hypothetical protein